MPPAHAAAHTQVIPSHAFTAGAQETAIAQTSSQDLCGHTGRAGERALKSHRSGCCMRHLRLSVAASTTAQEWSLPGILVCLERTQRLAMQPYATLTAVS